MKEMQVATLGGGCFWCLEAVYQELRGIERVVSGYAGGHVASPTYEQVITKTTGHCFFAPATMVYSLKQKHSSLLK